MRLTDKRAVLGALIIACLDSQSIIVSDVMVVSGCAQAVGAQEISRIVLPLAPIVEASCGRSAKWTATQPKFGAKCCVLSMTLARGALTSLWAPPNLAMWNSSQMAVVEAREAGRAYHSDGLGNYHVSKAAR